MCVCVCVCVCVCERERERWVSWGAYSEVLYMLLHKVSGLHHDNRPPNCVQIGLHQLIVQLLHLIWGIEHDSPERERGGGGGREGGRERVGESKYVWREMLVRRVSE